MIIVVDFGSQLAHLIAKKIRSLNEYSEIIHPSEALEAINKLKPCGIIFSGGPDSVYGENAPTIDKKIFDLNIPILGVCYGFHLIAYLCGGKVEPGSHSEYGVTKMKILEKHSLFEGLEDEEQVLMSHGDRVIDPPEGGIFISKTDSVYAAYVSDSRKLYGIQFHAEVTHTPKGMKIFENFLNICNAPRNWLSQHFIDKQVRYLQNIQKPVLMAVSGGVDSTVGATLLEKAVPDLLHCVLVDNGLLRLNEIKEIVKIYENLFKHFYLVDAKQLFFERLKGITDPEQKRKIIGNTFIEVFDKKAKELENKIKTKFRYLGQGTIYPDRVESAATSSQAQVIKTHHNVGGLPEKMELELVEPLKDLYKYEVREVGLKLGINKNLIERHPFPGPGLAVRCLGEVTPERIRILQEADSILRSTLSNDKRIDYNKLWQVFFVLLPVKTVGVMGDGRTYENAGVIRIVKSTDAMTAVVPEIPFDLLTKIAKLIINKVKGINRVTYDLTSKPPGTIEWE